MTGKWAGTLQEDKSTEITSYRSFLSMQGACMNALCRHITTIVCLMKTKGRVLAFISDVYIEVFLGQRLS